MNITCYSGFFLMLLGVSVCGQAITFVMDGSSTSGECQTKEGTAGICRPTLDCPVIFNRIAMERYRPKHCGFEGKTPIVCCPKQLDNIGITPPPGGEEPPVSFRIASPTINFNCGLREDEFQFGFGPSVDYSDFSEPDISGPDNPLGPPAPPRSSSGSSLPLPAPPPSMSGFNPGMVKRTDNPSDDYFNPIDYPFEEPGVGDRDYGHQGAVGGFVTKPHSWPWMAIFGYTENNGTRWFCDGVLINERWILTAAHCFLGTPDFFIRLGEHNHSDSRPNSPRQDFEVQQVIIHPKYDANRNYFDLGLIKLDRDVKINNAIRPVCLPWDDQSGGEFVGENVTLTGWGTTEFGGPPSDVLREAYVLIFDAQTCEERYSVLPRFNQDWPLGIKRDNVLCAGVPDGGIDACQGDSGGPLVLEEPFGGAHTLVGIISKGHGCGLKEFPGLYAPVSKELQWIKDNAFTV